jgi:hypothetical protein
MRVEMGPLEMLSRLAGYRSKALEHSADAGQRLGRGVRR